jgi:hypothetical protein
MGLRLVHSAQRTNDCDNKSKSSPTSSTTLPTPSAISRSAAEHLDVYRRLELVSPGHAELIRDIAARTLRSCQLTRAAGFTEADFND